MPLFRKRRSDTVVGPDGTEYAPVDAKVAHEMAVMLADRVVPQMQREVADWVGLVLTGTFGYIICSLRGEMPEGDTREVTSLALNVAKAGYEARIEEFAFLEQDGASQFVEDFVGHVGAKPDLAENPMGAVALAASTMMNASRQDPHNPEYVQYLAPIGAGHELHASVFAILTACLLGQDDAGQLRMPSGISVEELGTCMRYGYYVQACDASLPAATRAALEAQAR